MKIFSILLLTVVLCVASSDADHCGDLAAQAKNADSQLSYKSVKGCYQAQAFNRDVARKTIASLESLLSNFYVFTDIARAPTHAPFDTPRVDLLRGLKRIGDRRWKSDYDFQMALYYLLTSVNDGHLAYLRKHLGFTIRLSSLADIVVISLLESHQHNVSMLYSRLLPRCQVHSTYRALCTCGKW